MKKIAMIAALAVGALVITGCEKSAEEQLKDDAAKAQKEAGNAFSKAADSLGKTVDSLKK